MSEKNGDFIYNQIIIDTSLGANFQSDLSDIISIKDKIEIISSSFSKMMQGYMDCMKFIDYSSCIKTFSDILGSSFQTILQTCDYSSCMKSITENLSTYMDMAETIQKFTCTIPDIALSYEEIFSNIIAIPKEKFDVMLDGTDFTREDVLEDIGQFGYQVPETFDSQDLVENVLPEEKLNAYLKDHPALAYICFVICIIIGMLSNGQLANDTLLPMVQSTIVAMQGNEDVYFIKVGSAKLYAEPSSYSSVMMKLPYGEKVTLIESTKLWDKVTYIDSDKEEVVGWIAKRNLMTYCDYQFNAEDLYSLDVNAK